jgi:hypothetical protein
MTPNDFRKLALSLPEAVEAAHMKHPDFRVRGKIFATLGYPDAGSGMVKLTPAEQQLFVRSDAATFQPVAGAWGRRGCTTVLLRAANEDTVYQALVSAWRNVAPKRLVEEFDNA